MTLEEKLVKVNKWRLRGNHLLASEDHDEWNGHFHVPLEGEIWQITCSSRYGWKHLSVTNSQKKMLPDWNILCRLRELFFDDTAWVVQYHPPRTEYVNDHPFVLHLWQPIWDTLPTPPIWMV